MPYKTKKNRLVNEVTLGDGYPLSNDLQPLKVGGEASPIEMSKQLPDGSDNGKVKVRGDLEVTGGLNFKNDVEVDLSFDDLSLSGDLDVAGDVTVDTDTLKVDTTNNRVGIGNSSPNHLLHVGDDAVASFGTTPDKAIQLSSTTNDHEIAYILYAADGTNNIRSKYYVDDATKYVGWDSTYSSGLFGYEWKIANTQKMKLDTSGNLTLSGTVDGRDVATDGTKLDGIEASATADQTNVTGTAATVTAGTQAAITTCANLTTTGALGAGTIASGFGAIDNGASAITTTGTLTGGNGVCGGTTSLGKWTQVWSGRAYTQYDNWYLPNSVYGIGYYQWQYSVSSIPSTWGDDRNPIIVVPHDCVLNSYYIWGNINASETIEFALMKGTNMAWDDSDGDVYDLTNVGSTQSSDWTAVRGNKLGQTGLSVSLSEGDNLIPFIRRTTTNTSLYKYVELNLTIVATLV